MRLSNLAGDDERRWNVAMGYQLEVYASLSRKLHLG